MNWPLITTIISAAAALVGGLILWNLNKLNENIKAVTDRIAGQERETSAIKDRLATCRQDCDRTMSTALQDLDRDKVSKGDWIRSEAYTRAKLDDICKTLASVQASIGFVEKIPQIVSAVVRETLSSLRRDEA